MGEANAASLMRRLQDPDGDVRAAACAALAVSGTNATVGQSAAIAACIEDIDPDVCLAALRALVKLGPAASSHSGSVAKFLGNVNPDICSAASNALDAMNGTDLDELVDDELARMAE